MYLQNCCVDLRVVPVDYVAARADCSLSLSLAPSLSLCLVYVWEVIGLGVYSVLVAVGVMLCVVVS